MLCLSLKTVEADLKLTKIGSIFSYVIHGGEGIKIMLLYGREENLK